MSLFIILKLYHVSTLSQIFIALLFTKTRICNVGICNVLIVNLNNYHIKLSNLFYNKMTFFIKIFDNFKIAFLYKINKFINAILILFFYYFFIVFIPYESNFGISI